MRTTAPVSLLLAAALLSGSCDKASELAFEGEAGGLHSIAYLKSLCTAASVPVREEISIRGRVVSSDRYGEFSRMLVIEDASGGISLAAEHPSLASEYPFGSCITVRCNGLTLCDYGGKIQLGTTPGEYGAGRIPSDELSRYIQVEEPPQEAPEALPLVFADISARHIDTYVRFDDVRFIRTGPWCDADPETGLRITTEQPIADPAGNTFRVRTLGTCTYAEEPVPSGTGSLKGVIDYFGGKYTLRIVNRDAEFVSAEAPPTAYP